jgi:hypothetical protein
MATRIEASNLPASPFSFWADLAKSFGWPPLGAGAAGLAPSALNQPILPDWTFGNSIVINEKNSSSPETEREILAGDSYGRQLGTLTDALAVLIAAMPEATRQDPAVTRLLALKARVDATKTQVAAARLRRIESDLATLKKNDNAEYRRIVAAVEAGASSSS